MKNSQQMNVTFLLNVQTKIKAITSTKVKWTTKWRHEFQHHHHHHPHRSNNQQINHRYRNEFSRRHSSMHYNCRRRRRHEVVVVVVGEYSSSASSKSSLKYLASPFCLGRLFCLSFPRFLRFLSLNWMLLFIFILCSCLTESNMS